MHHYPFHVADYVVSTSHLSPIEDIAYRRLIDLYYTSEAPIPLETQWVARKIRVDHEVVLSVLSEFFAQQNDGYHNRRCDEEIAKYVEICERNRTNGKAGGRPKSLRKEDKNPMGSDSVTTGNPDLTQKNPNQEPRTKNQDKDIAERKRSAEERGSRLPKDWVLPKTWGEWALQERPEWDGAVVRSTADKFADYWWGQPLSKARKADWFATWRNWVRNDHTKINGKPRDENDIFAGAIN